MNTNWPNGLIFMNGSVLTVYAFNTSLRRYPCAWTFSPVCHILHVIYYDVVSRTIAFAVYLHTLAVIQFAMHAVHASATVYVRQLFFYILSDAPQFAVRLMENALLLWSLPEKYSVQQRTNLFFRVLYNIYICICFFSFCVGFYFLSWFI